MTSPADARRIAERYPAPRRGRWLGWGLAVVLAALLGGWMVWAGLQAARPAVAAEIRGYHVTSAQQAEATLRIERADPASTVTCQLVAQDASHRRVGVAEVTLAPGGAKQVDVSKVITTIGLAVTVTIDGCHTG